ncbi:MAG: hypothetical protein OXH52_12025 [Gammaproteobacteria bacterium]|nr:hypothetical protein [Gammaproteobacteria bacterium]
MEFEAVQPGPGVDGAAPAGPLLFDDLGRGVGERRHALGAALFGQGIATLAGELAVGQRPLPRLGERYQGGATESEFTFPALDDEPLDPAPRPGGLDDEVEALPVTVPAGRGGTDEGGRQGLVGVTASADAREGGRRFLHGTLGRSRQWPARRFLE